MKIIHNRIPRGAIKSLTGNLNSAMSNRKNGNIKEFTLKPKRKKDVFSEECLFEDEGFPAWIGKIKGHYKNKRRKTPLNEIMNLHQKGLIVFHDKITSRYYLHIPVDMVSSPKNNVENQNVISLDTGVRTFQTGYSVHRKEKEDICSGEIIEIGKGDSLHLLSLLKKTDVLEKKHQKTNKKKYQNQRLKLFVRIRNLVSELHWKTISFLLSNYSTIIIPDFRISGMVRTNKISKDTKRLLYIFSYNQFKRRLLWKASIDNKRVLVVDESYTSKTCGRCGWQNNQLRGDKMFCCKQCSLVIDRDANGARNILLKHL